MHGKTSAIHHNGRGIFVGLPNPFSATRYHSLIVAHENLPAKIQVTARTDDGLIMGLQHKTALLYGVQFHPESILTENGYQLLANFLAIGDSIAINPAIIAARNDYLSKLHQATNS
jgi:anthranilate synthase/aminodeoxychorismate synthase-like glutamine amidotransferase